MKKIMKKVALFVCAIAMSVSFTSCNEETIVQILNILQELSATRGTTYNFEGQIQSRLLILTANGDYMFGSKDGAYTTTNITLPVTMTTTSANIVIPAMKVDGASMTAVNLSNLANTTSANGGTITVGDNTTGDATLTVDGKAYPIYTIFLEGCTYTSTGSMTAKTMQVYFGENGEYVADFTFSGKVAE